MRLSLRSFAFAAFAVAGLATSSARADISTLGSWDGSKNATSWGSPGSGVAPTFGETFSPNAGTGTTLTNMLFEIKSTNSTAISYKAYVYAWTGSATTGAALFTSTTQTYAAGAGFTAVSVAVPSLALTSGSNYVALFSTLGLAGTGTTGWGDTPDDTAYAGGTFVYNTTQSGAPDTVLASSTNWDAFGAPQVDLAFTLSLSGALIAVPEPSTWALMSVGVIAAGSGAFLRRKKASAAA